jgi:Flp pilus assembly protein TadG
MPTRGLVGLLAMKDTEGSPDMAREFPLKGKPMRADSRHSEDGSSLIEFALCLGPLMLLMTGIFAFGIAVANYVQLTNACSAGAMQVAISRGNLASPYDPCATVVSTVQAAAPSLTAGSMKFVVVLDGTTYPTGGTPTSSLSCTSTSNTTGAAANLVQGQAATVTVTYPCNLSVYKANNFPSCVLTAKASELVQ